MKFLVIDDDKPFRDATCLLIEEEGHHAEPAASGELALARMKEEEFEGVLLDLNLGEENGLDILARVLKNNPNQAVIMLPAQGTVKTAVEAMRAGALDFLEKPFTREQFHSVAARLQRFLKLSENIERLEDEVKENKAQNPELLMDWTTPVMREAMDVLWRAAKTPAPILILGESGTGKSVLARTVQQRSLLAEQPFVTISCPSLSKELLESELFGHVKGSFTGAARDHWGKVKAAEGGTLFLDEISDLPLEIQPKLLRLLQEREYERLGENVTRQANIRIIAATNRDLKKRMSEGAFREDLYFRLNVITVEMPPLRARQEDLLRFAEHYLQYFAGQCARRLSGFTSAAIGCIKSYPWPGNLRELRNAIERAVILAKHDQIDAEDLPSELRQPASHSGNGGEPSLEAGALISIAKLEEFHVRKILKRSSSMVEAASILGIDQATLYRKRKKIGLH